MKKYRITYCGDGWYQKQMWNGSVWDKEPGVNQYWQYDQLSFMEQRLVDVYRSVVQHGLEGYWIEY